MNSIGRRALFCSPLAIVALSGFAMAERVVTPPPEPSETILTMTLESSTPLAFTCNCLVCTGVQTNQPSTHKVSAPGEWVDTDISR